MELRLARELTSSLETGTPNFLNDKVESRKKLFYLEYTTACRKEKAGIGRTQAEK